MHPILRALPSCVALTCARLGLALILLTWIMPSPARAQSQPGTALLLRDEAGSVDAWPAISVRDDPSGTLTAQDVAADRHAFRPAGPMGANLGKRTGAVWLRIPVEVPAGASGRWILDIDYASLDHIELRVLDEQLQVERLAQLGDHVDWQAREWPTRSHAVALDLPPGHRRVLLLRVQTTGSWLVPVWLHTPRHFHAAESREQALQGLIAGAGLVLLVYSLAQWRSLRDPMFAWYALTLLGTTGFFAALSGMGPQYVWGWNTWLVRNAPPFTILLGVCGAFFFVLRALEVRTVSPRVARIVQACGWIAGGTAVLFGLGALSYATAQRVGMALGPAPLLLVLPTAFRRLKEGDHAAKWILWGWTFYSFGVLAIVSVLVGWLPVNFWTLHAFQFASLIEMGTWMVVLAQRVQAIRRQAQVLQGEHERLHSMAHTDGLTGLLNRRGLQAMLGPRLARAAAGGQPIAVYLLDLDGFKPVNDALGHEAGDRLLVEVARRLQALVRSTDVVCRLGGDEFVLAVGPLTESAEAEAEQIGMKLLKAFDQPFLVGDQVCRVGLTVGYSLAPQDDATLEGLLKRADAAMYAGKQAGRHCLRRGGTSAVWSAHA